MQANRIMLGHIFSGFYHLVVSGKDVRVYCEVAVIIFCTGFIFHLVDALDLKNQDTITVGEQHFVSTSTDFN